ncbi:hypothetical protein JB92DRAFT_3106579 [Gautieria morchelliformis]|nr:hypothetical protein JB92DRAFT_3106579 [Gautieria morchelliformis]
MSGRYAPLPNPLAPDAERELDAAFESDEDEAQEETTPLNSRKATVESAEDPLTDARVYHLHDAITLPRASIPGAYDFEADPFDYAAPPPGSPPGPTTLAIPNQYGNSNGLIPTGTVIPRQTDRRTGFFRRAVGALLPSHYQRVPTEEGALVVPARGGGTNNDGVFANMTAKPGRGIVVQEGESIHVVPEEVQKEVPPSYAVAQADSAPAYYETIVHAPSSGLDGEVLVDAMPTGSIFTFAWTMLISLSFQFVGFLLTYLLHTTHAARFGSRAGLGVTIIQYAFFLRRRAVQGAASQYEESKDAQLWFDSHPAGGDDFSLPGLNETMSSTPDVYPGYFTPATTEWMSFLLMSIGWFVLLTSLLGFWRVKRWEHGIRQASEPPTSTTEALYGGARVPSLRNLFGVIASDDPEDVAPGALDEEPATDEDIRLARDLRASGLL